MPPATDLAGAADPARILLIEPDPRTALLVGEMLRASWEGGLVVALTEGLAEGTQELIERGASCVLLDLAVADVDRVEAIGQIRNAAPDVPVIALTDRSDKDDALRAIRAGAQDCLAKSELFPDLLARSLRHAIERKQSEVRLAHMALHDPLTGLPNRALFLDRLSVALDRSRRTTASVAVLFLDVDNFKQVNDSLGHAAGDRLLVGLSERLSGMLRPMDTVARFGGDEFTFLFEDLASEREVVLIAERIGRTVRAPIALMQGEASITVSIGIAVVSDPSAVPESVIRDADAAMYRAKELGRARYELFDEASRQRASDRLELEAALRHAVDRGELRVHYQPEVSLGHEPSVIGLEALVRWQHPERGLLGPDGFVPLAEESGLVIGIGDFVLKRALQQLSRWRQLKPDLKLAINLSPRQLEDTGLPSMVDSALRAVDLPPDSLCLDLPERAVTHNPAAARRALESLKALGVMLAIDDFGTGSLSLSSLKRLPIDALKVDRSFVTELGVDPAHGSVIGAIVDLGHALGLKVIAEGVETDAQLAAVRSLGCDAGEGFLLGRPVPEEQVDSVIAPSPVPLRPGGP